MSWRGASVELPNLRGRLYHEEVRLEVLHDHQHQVTLKKVCN